MSISSVGAVDTALIEIRAGGRVGLPITIDDGEEVDMGGGLTWDAVTLMSIAMVAISILIIVYLVYKVITLMNRDAEAHKNNER